MHTTTGHVDVLITGAGLSGIGGACQLRRNSPGRSFAILESRAASGGTWGLFRYLTHDPYPSLARNVSIAALTFSGYSANTE